ncbi:MAG: hypothetical protein BWY54_00900 [Candidatus Dependentiae bacterium ADurb.Bin331]|nr:MAG: hypothetical protein BWY54_00900 [Candidatus Dependentiae bacterium ADurb.Bin331]
MRTKHRVTAGNNHELLMNKLYETMDERKNIVFAIRVPVLIIYGELDPLVLPSRCQCLVKTISNAICEPIHEMGHMFFSNDIENKIISNIVKFLDQH